MTSNSETFVVVPHEKFNAMEEQLRQQHPPRPKTPTPPPTPSDESNEDEKKEEVPPLQTKEPSAPVPEEIPERGTTLSEGTKEMVKNKSLHKRAFHKFLQAVSTVGKSKPDFENLEGLIRGALSQSKRLLPNEESFYIYLLEHGLMHLVKNRSKISRYYPSWFRAA